MREKIVAVLLAFFLGGFGFHRFYLGQKKLGFVYLLFFWTVVPFIMGVVDALLLLVKHQDDFDLQYNSEYYLGESQPQQRRALNSPQNDGRIPIATFSTADEIEKLHNLMLRGIISEEEFAERKNRL
jgi:TM2 domain-containing membrane protein YozV